MLFFVCELVNSSHFFCVSELGFLSLYFGGPGQNSKKTPLPLCSFVSFVVNGFC
jgi:hypothetical protein